MSKLLSPQQLSEGFQKQKVLVIGDVMIDSYIWGKTERISPEAPVPVVDVHKREVRLGGAANVALNIKSLGAEPILCGLVGNDIKGKEFSELLSQLNMRSDAIITSDERVTTTKHRVISSAQQMLRIDEEVKTPLSSAEFQTISDKIFSIVDSVDVIIFEDYDKGCITPELIEKVVSKANKLNIPTVVDPKKRNFLDYKGVTLFKPNLKEIKEGLNVQINPSSKESIDQANQALKEKLNHTSTLITLSEYGVYFNKENESFTIPAHIRKIADVSGAGDTVVAVASLCLGLGASDYNIAAISNLAGGLVCEYVGVKPIELSLLMSEIQQLS